MILTATKSEVTRDHRLYCANFLEIPAKSGEMIPFEWNAPQERLAAAVRWQEDRGLPIRVIVLKSRQVGISTWVQSFFTHRCHLRHNRTALTLAHNVDSAEGLFQKQRLSYEQLPKTGPLAAPKQSFTRKRIQYKNTNSLSQTDVAGAGAGRSRTAQYVHLSELAFYENAKETLQGLKQSVPRLPDSAVFIESTPKGWGNTFHKAYMAAKKKRSEYIAVFIAWFDDPSCTTTPWFTEDEYDEEERALAAAHGLTVSQVAWRRLTIANECDGDVEVFQEEYPSDDRTCFLVSGRPAFDKKGLQYQLDALPEPDPWEGAPPACEITWNAEDKKPVVEPVTRGRLRIWGAHPKPRHRYVVGADPSEGDPGSTASPIAILDTYDLSLAGLWYGRTPSDLLAEKAVMLAQYFNEALLIWEMNNHGLGFWHRVRDLEYGNYWMRQVSAESVAQRITDKAGYMNTMKARADLIDTLRKYIREAVEKGWPVLRDPILVNELTTLVFEEDKAVPQEGELMDTLIAFGLCLIAHRGNMESPLEPASRDELERAMRDVGWKLSLGLKPTELEMSPYGMTADELAQYDEKMDKRNRWLRGRGLGRMH